MGEKVLLLDSDVVRDQVGNQGYDDEAREMHIMDIADYAAIAEKQGFLVIVAIISPKKEWRMKARKKFEKSMLIYMPDGKLWEGTEYEEPDHEEMMVEG
jgi:adenylylsulfate kinase-like enzyme